MSFRHSPLSTRRDPEEGMGADHKRDKHVASLICLHKPLIDKIYITNHVLFQCTFVLSFQRQHYRGAYSHGILPAICPIHK